MPRSRKAVKRTKKTVVKQNKKRISHSVKDSIVGKLWKPKQTVRSNYAKMGLAAVVNEDSAVAVRVNARKGTLDASSTSSLALGTGQLQVVGETSLTATSGCEYRKPSKLKEKVMKELQDVVNSPAPPRVFMFEGDQEFVERLLARHGEGNFAQMARDSKLNPYQLTPAQIRKKFERYDRFNREMSERGVDPAATRSAGTRLPCDTWNVFPKMC